MPKYHLPNGQVYSSDTDLTSEELDHLAGGGSAPAPAQPAEPSFLDRLGGWRGVLGGGIRAGSAILGAEGGPTGAAISGGGEALAELAEGSDLSPAKIGVEAGFGLIPFNKIVKAAGLGGKLVAPGILGSAARSGALGAAHQAASDIAGGETPTAGGVATAGGLGALLGGGASAFMKAAPAVPKLAGQMPKMAEEAGTKIFQPGPEEIALSKTNRIPLHPNLSPSLQSGYSEAVRSKLGSSMSKAMSEVGGPEDLKANIAATKAAAAKTRAENFRSDLAAGRAESTADLQNLRSTIAQKAKEAKAGDIQSMIDERGLVPGAPAITKSISGTTAEGEQLSARTPFKKPKGEKAGSWTEESDIEPMAEPRQPIMDEPAGAVSPADTATVAPTEPAPVAAPATKRQGVSKVQKFNKGIADILGATPEITSEAAPAVAAEEPASPLAQFFKSPVDAAGQNYRAAKAAEGENPLAKQQAGVALQSEAQKAGLPTRGSANLADFLEKKVSPEIGPTAAPAAAPEAVPGVEQQDWAKRQSDLVDRLKSEKGALNPRATALLGRVGAGGLGALIGAPVGEWANPDDPDAALKGALGGGILGFAGAGGAQEALAKGQGMAGGAATELTRYRNAGLLSSLSAQLKKPLSDLSAIIGEGAERTLTPGSREQGLNILKELFRLPTNVGNYGAALKNPQLAGEVIGDALRSATPPEQGLLGWVGRPFGAAQYASQKILERAGVPLDEARDILFLGDPKTKIGGWWHSAQDPRVTGETGSKFVRAVRPFNRIATNLAERGAQRIPGVSLVTGDPRTRLGRTILGAGAMGAGALTGMSDEAGAEAGEEPTSPMLRGLRRAALASYALPYMAGEALTGPYGARDIFYSIPGLKSTVDPLAPKDTLFSYGGKQLRNWLDQMLPSWANPTDAEKPIR